VESPVAFLRDPLVGANVSLRWCVSAAALVAHTRAALKTGRASHQS
jgi:hypothetical protein